MSRHYVKRWTVSVGVGVALLGLPIGGIIAAPAASAASAASAVHGSLPTTGGAFVSVAPTRILDTRSAIGAPHAVAPHSAVTLQVTGAADVPATGVGAVALNVTATQPTSTGFITAYADGAPTPSASNLNFRPHESVANLVIATVNPSTGAVDLYNGSDGTVQLVADISGYFLSGTPSGAGAFGAVTPTRLLDTRSGIGAAQKAIGGHQIAAIQVIGANGVPAGVSAVVLNVTATQPTSTGFITGYADGTAPPTASNVNFTAGQTVPKLVVAPVNPVNGTVDLYNGSTGTVQLLADISGYFLSGTPTSAGGFGSVAPLRLLDTRNAIGAPRRPVAGHGSVSLRVTGSGGVPAAGVTAVLLNVTANQPLANGFLSAYADGAATPVTSNVNFVAGATVPNLVVAPVSAAGLVTIYNGSAGAVQVIADVDGYFLSGSSGSGFGNDISWAQCGESFPAGAAFGIVGVNDGLANNTNPCLGEELSWAQNSAGGAGQPAAALYVNTANPGPANTTSWPASNNYPGSTSVTNPYGACNGSDSPACAYMYGYAKAYDDANSRGVSAPTTFNWWLDVESDNTWETNTASNVADLQGMAAYFTSIGSQVGVYASRADWRSIAGTVASTNPLSALPEWLAGASSLAVAEGACHSASLMTGPVSLVQYDATTTDFDVACS